MAPRWPTRNMPSEPIALAVAGIVALLFWAYAWSKALFTVREWSDAE